MAARPTQTSLCACPAAEARESPARDPRPGTWVGAVHRPGRQVLGGEARSGRKAVPPTHSPALHFLGNTRPCFPLPALQGEVSRVDGAQTTGVVTQTVNGGLESTVDQGDCDIGAGAAPCTQASRGQPGAIQGCGAARESGPSTTRGARLSPAHPPRRRCHNLPRSLMKTAPPERAARLRPQTPPPGQGRAGGLC